MPFASGKSRLSAGSGSRLTLIATRGQQLLPPTSENRPNPALQGRFGRLLPLLTRNCHSLAGNCRSRPTIGRGAESGAPGRAYAKGHGLPFGDVGVAQGDPVRLGRRSRLRRARRCAGPRGRTAVGCGDAETVTIDHSHTEPADLHLEKCCRSANYDLGGSASDRFKMGGEKLTAF